LKLILTFFCALIYNAHICHLSSMKLRQPHWKMHALIRFVQLFAKLTNKPFTRYSLHSLFVARH
jgi:hypothetical protein